MSRSRSLNRDRVIKRDRIMTGFITLLVCLIAIVFLYPYVWMLCASFKENREIYKPLQLLPKQWDLQYFKMLFSGEYFSFQGALGRSLTIAGIQALGATVIAAAAGYVFAHHRFRLAGACLFAALLVIIIPKQVMVLPLYAWLIKLGLNGQMAGVILPGLISGVGILFFSQVFRQIPKPLLESARMDGASESRVFASMLPLVMPALLTYFLVHFILASHEHLLPLLVLQEDDQRTLPLALSSLYGSSLRYPRAVIMAASSLAVLPSALLFALLYRQFRSALRDVLSS